MFTGIVKQIGKVITCSSLNGGLDVTISCDTTLFKMDIGDSICVNGVCSTVIDYNDQSFQVQYLEETLNKTSFSTLSVGAFVNLEPSLTLATKLSGHFVQGHVDATGVLTLIENNDPWGVIKIEFNQKFAALLIEKGSVSIDGISLTVVNVTETTFQCYIIPHTFQETILQYKSVGDKVNLEFDMIGKYIGRFKQLGELHG